MGKRRKKKNAKSCSIKSVFVSAAFLCLINLPLEDRSVSLMHFYHCSLSYSTSLWRREKKWQSIRCLPLHLKPALRVCSAQACGKVNNVCCSGFISQQPLGFPLFSAAAAATAAAVSVALIVFFLIINRNDGVCQCSCRSDLSGTHSVKYQTGDADQSKLLTRLLKRDPETATQGGQASYSLRQGCATSIFSISLLENIKFFFGGRQIKPNKRHSTNHYNHLLHGRNLAKP